jgi:flagellar hook-associated protein FlgK
MLTYQRAYEAAARVMSAMDAALDTLINHIQG